MRGSGRDRRARAEATFWTIIFGVLIAILFGLIAFYIGESVEDDGKTYNYVIVGGGAAGASLAEFLSRDPDVTVLLIEAGGDFDGDPRINTIGPVTGGLEPLFFSKWHWPEPQEYPEVVPGNPRLQLTGGRLLGGGSSINGAQYVRGTNWTFQNWFDRTGDEIWGPDNVLRVYKDLETFESDISDPSRHGYSGRLHVTETMTVDPQPEPTVLSFKFVQAMSQLLDQPPIDDYNCLEDNCTNGFFYSWQLTAYPNATRSSSSISFLTDEVRARENLHILLYSTVTHVLFSEGHAYGVEYLQNGRCHRAKASTRVVLTAGVHTAPILQRSGYGDADYLASLDIPVVYNNTNVGKIYWNQQLVSAVFNKNVDDIPSANPMDIYEGGAFLPSANPPWWPLFQDEDSSPRRIQMIVINTGDQMILALINLQPQEPGYVKIRNKDPLQTLISSDQIYYQEAGLNDWYTYMFAIRQYVCGLNSVYQGDGPGPAVDDTYLLVDPDPSICFDDDALLEWVRTHTTEHTHHWTSSCRMGTAEDDGISVVNNKGSVRGVTGLTIADNSILPREHDGNTVAPAYLVARIIGEQLVAGNY